MDGWMHVRTASAHPALIAPAPRASWLMRIGPAMVTGLSAGGTLAGATGQVARA
jgi:hypothetical protein